MLADSDKLKLMEMSDNHVEYHTVGEFIEFCVNGPTKKAGAPSPASRRRPLGSDSMRPRAGKWESIFRGQYLKGGKKAGGQLVDQRMLPRISEGEVRMLMVKDKLYVIIHKKPVDGLSAVGGNSKYTYYSPGSKTFAELERKFMAQDLPQLRSALAIENEPLPLLWTADFIPMDGAKEGSTEYVVGEFNCSCVGISQFQAVCGGDKTVADVPDKDYYEASQLTDLMGKTSVEILDEIKAASVTAAPAAGDGAPARPTGYATGNY